MSLSANDLPDAVKSENRTSSTVPMCTWRPVALIAYCSECFIGLFFILMTLHIARYFMLSLYYGPLVVAVRKMIVSVIKFFLLFVLVIYGYGVLSEILLYPGMKSD